jgi:hypothetical protein
VRVLFPLQPASAHSLLASFFEILIALCNPRASISLPQLPPPQPLALKCCIYFSVPTGAEHVPSYHSSQCLHVSSRPVPLTRAATNIRKEISSSPANQSDTQAQPHTSRPRTPCKGDEGRGPVCTRLTGLRRLRNTTSFASRPDHGRLTWLVPSSSCWFLDVGMHVRVTYPATASTRMKLYDAASNNADDCPVD